MKASSFLFLLLFILAIGVKMDNSVNRETEENENPMAPDEWFNLQRTWPYDYVDDNAIKNAREYLRISKLNAAKLPLTADWVFAGPNVYGGRVTDIEMPDGNVTNIFVASASGGVFRTDDFGNTWTPIFDSQSALSIGDIAFPPGDSMPIFVGTGEPNAGGGSLAYDGNGIYRANGTGIWMYLGLGDCGSTGRIAIDPVNHYRIYAAMMGNLFQKNSNRGVYRSLDGGITWQQSLFVSDSTGAIDVVIDPLHPDTVYASMWERVRRPSYRRYGGPTSGVYRSFDGGSTWTKLNALLPSVNKGRINLSINRQNPAILYASVIDPNGSLINVYKTSNYGDSWTGTNAAGSMSTTSYDWWFGGIKVDPYDPNRLYMLLMQAYSSTDGGQTWSNMAPASHVDHHALCFMSQPGHMILGNDGGVNFTSDYFQNYTGIFQQNIPIAQLYAMDVAKWDSSYLMVGAQDNNVYRKAPSTGNLWQAELGGDGVNCRINQLDPTEAMYMSYQYGGFYFTNNNTGYYPWGFDPNERFNWKAPITPSPTLANNVYVGGNHVYKSTDEGQSFSMISPDLTNGAGTMPVSFGTVTSIAVSTTNENVIYAGTDDGNLWKTVNGGTNWVSINTGLPHRWVTSIKVHPQDADKAWVTYSGYRYGENITHVYATQNGGLNWNSISGNLPDVPVNDIFIDSLASGLYFLATDIGVFYTQDAGTNWQIMGQALPTLPVIELSMHYNTHTLFAATYGRGIYKLNVGEFTGIAPKENSIIANVFPNPFTTDINIVVSVIKSGRYDVILYDAQGKICYKNSVHFTAGQRNYRINIPPGSPGLYYLNLRNSTSQKILKLIRQ